MDYKRYDDDAATVAVDEDQQQYGSPPWQKRIIPIIIIIFFIIAALIFFMVVFPFDDGKIHILDDKNKAIIFTGSINTNGELVNTLGSTGTTLHLSGRPNEKVKIKLFAKNLPKGLANGQIALTLSNGQHISLNVNSLHIDANGQITIEIDPTDYPWVTDTNAFDQNGGHFTIDVTLSDPNTNSDVVIEIPTEIEFKEFSGEGCVQLSRSSVNDITHFGQLSVPLKVRLSCDSAELQSSVTWNGPRKGTVEILWGQSKGAALSAESQGIPTLSPGSDLEAQIVFVPFKEFAGTKSDFTVNFTYANTTEKVSFNVAADNLEQCIKTNTPKITMNGASESFTIDASACYSPQIEVVLCQNDNLCAGGNEGGIQVSPLMFTLSPKSNPTKTITVSRIAIPGEYGISINAKALGSASTYIGEEDVLVQPNAGELVVPDRFSVSLLGDGSRDFVRIHNSLLSEDVAITTSICSLYNASTGKDTTPTGRVLAGSANAKSWWQDLATSKTKTAGVGKYQSALLNALPQIESIRAAVQDTSKLKNSAIKQAYLAAVATDLEADKALAKAKTAYDDMKDLDDKASKWNSYKGADIASNIISLTTNMATLTTVNATAFSVLSTASGITTTYEGSCSGCLAALTLATAATTKITIAEVVNAAQIATSLLSMTSTINSMANTPEDIDTTTAVQNTKEYYDMMVELKKHTAQARAYLLAAMNAASIDSFPTASSDDAEAKRNLELAKVENDIVVTQSQEARNKENKAIDAITVLQQKSDTLLSDITSYVGMVQSLASLIEMAKITATSVPGLITAANTTVGLSGTAASGSCALCPEGGQCACCGLQAVAVSTQADLTAATSSYISLATTMGIVTTIINVANMAYNVWRTLTMDYVQALTVAKTSAQASLDETDQYTIKATEFQSLLDTAITAADYLTTQEATASRGTTYNFDELLQNDSWTYDKKRMEGLISTAIINGWVNGAYEGGVYTTQETAFDKLLTLSPRTTSTPNTSAQHLFFSDTQALNPKNNIVHFDNGTDVFTEDCDNQISLTLPDYVINLVQDPPALEVSNDLVSTAWSNADAKVFGVFEEQETSLIFGNNGLKNDGYGVVTMTVQKHSHANPTKTSGNEWGPFNLPVAASEPLVYKYHFKLNGKPRSSVPTNNVSPDCGNGILLAGKGAATLPNTILGWDWNAVPLTYSGKEYLDATQLSILLGKKLGQLNSLLAQNTLSCPANPASTVLLSVAPNDLAVPTSQTCYIPKTTDFYDGLPGLYYYFPSFAQGIIPTAKESAEQKFLSMVDFNANLMMDGYGTNFQKDFTYAFKYSFLAASPDFTDQYNGVGRYFDEEKRAYYTSETLNYATKPNMRIPDAGTYEVRPIINLTDDAVTLIDSGALKAKMLFTLSLKDPVVVSSPFYYTPIDGIVGLKNSAGRMGYGTSITTNASFPIENVDKTGIISNQLLTVAKLKYTLLQDPAAMNSLASLRGRLLDYRYADGNGNIVFSPSTATPLLFTVNASDTSGGSLKYTLEQGITRYSRGNNLFLLSGLNNCVDFNGRSAQEIIRSPDMLAKDSYVYNLGDTTKTETAYMKTIAFMPLNLSLGLAVSSNAEVQSTHSQANGETVLALTGIQGMRRNYALSGDTISDLASIYSAVKDGQVCVSHMNGEEVYFWPEDQLYKQKDLNGPALTNQITTIESACQAK